MPQIIQKRKKSTNNTFLGQKSNLHLKNQKTNEKKPFQLNYSEQLPNPFILQFYLDLYYNPLIF
jgi:hypothetical protein